MAIPSSLPSPPPVPRLDTEHLQSAYGKEVLGHREPITALPETPRYQKAAAHQFLQTPPTISISQTHSESNMHRGFSFRRANSNAGPKPVVEKPLPIPGHSRSHSSQSVASWQQNGGGLMPGQTSGGLQRSMSKRQKFVRAITNPDKIFDRDPASPPPESRYVQISVVVFGFNPVLRKQNSVLLHLRLFSRTVGLCPSPDFQSLSLPQGSTHLTLYWVTHHCLSLFRFRKMKPNYFRRIRSQSNLHDSTNLREPTSRFNPNPNSKLARTFFGNGRVDFGSGAPVAPPTPPTPSIPLPDLEEPLFNSHWIPEKVAIELPSGYTMRPMCRGDYGRGYMDVLRVVGRTGWVGEEVWEERCEWLRTMSSTYFILVVVNPEDRIVASGTLMMERKFVHNLGTVGHVEDLAVARDQKGKKMGLRVLEALVHVAQTAGCYKVRLLIIC